MSVANSSFISSRRARRSYGTVILVPFVEDEHNKKNAIKRPEGKMAQKMFWHIKKVRGLQYYIVSTIIVIWTLTDIYPSE